MKKSSFYHRPKSEMAYQSDKEKITIRLQTLKEITKNVKIVYGDPFSWDKAGSQKTFSWMKNIDEMQKIADTSHHDYYQCELTRQTKRTKYAFLIDDKYLYGSKYLLDVSQSPEELENLDNFFNFPYLLEEDMYDAPEWVQDRVWYSIFPERFATKDNHAKNILPWDSVDTYDNTMFFGGNLKGMCDKLEYIKAMGFNGIYLTPIFKAPSAHKYDTVDYFEIDPQFGSKEDLRHFVQKAHELDIRIMLDAVFNHVSHQHPFFQDVSEKGKESQYYDYFFIRETPFSQESFKKAIKNKQLPPYETFAFTPRMPKLNTANKALREYLIDVGEYWIKAFDIDGWRLDVSNEISHDFWREFRKRIKAIKPEAFILGENWDNSFPWLQGDQHDSVMNYEFTFPLWQFYQKETFASFDAKWLSDAITETMMSYPEPLSVNLFNLLDSHDTKRIATTLNNDEALIKQIYLFMFLLPGTPSIYYGGEVGMQGGDDPDNRRCMIWDETKQNQTIKDFMKKLIDLYHTHQAFKSAEFDILAAQGDLIIVKKGTLRACFNRGDTTINLPQGMEISGTDCFDHSVKQIKTLHPKAFHLLKKE